VIEGDSVADQTA